MKYKKRVSDDLILRKLKGKGAVLVQGPKWCGKTTSCSMISKSSLYLADPNTRDQNLSLIELDPSRILQGETPRLIDEWQEAPKLWDIIRFEVDKRNKEGQFILTGSSVPCDSSQLIHTGTGRYAWLTMRTMSLFESDESSGEVSLSDLFEQKGIVSGTNRLKIDDLAYLCCRGGWPRSLFMEKDIALDQAFDYYDAIVRSDMTRVDGVQRSGDKVKSLLRSYARNQGQQVSAAMIAQDMKANEGTSLDERTVLDYIEALRKIFVIEESLAWNPNLRSKASVRTSNTRYFVDPSIGVAALGIGPNDLLNDLKTFGFIFESLCIRDLRVYADYLNGQVYHYRDSYNLECDAVIHLRNGNYGLIEIKLGGNKLIEEGATTLKKLRDGIDTKRMKKPAFLMVLVGTGEYAYQRQDGVIVVPIGTLAP